MKTLKKYDNFLKDKKINESFGNDELNYMIDYTSLTNTETNSDIIKLCNNAKILGTASVCVYPKYVKLSSECLKESDVKVCTVISFPEGSNSIQDKIKETKKAIADGADEIDMVLNYKLLKEDSIENYDYLLDDVSSLVLVCHDNINKLGEKVILKVIVESGLLTEEETKIATEICLEAGADFIKTSTGKVSVGAELNKVKVMFTEIKNQNSDMKIKASGGVKTMDDMLKFKPYVDRFGMGYASVDEINGIKSDGDKY